MAKVRTTLTVNEVVLRAVKMRAGRTGRDSEVIEDVLRRELGFDLLARSWERNALDPADAETLALEAQRFARR